MSLDHRSLAELSIWAKTLNARLRPTIAGELVSRLKCRRAFSSFEAETAPYHIRVPLYHRGSFLPLLHLSPFRPHLCIAVSPTQLTYL